ncbi:hypothetical protein BXZ70DRAFT_759575 [Cristinia sonorae]|uniref:DUF6534 domain-containing protein n=1 Tax=Cristinia sonorae TaxID=1940300 RepID=A0A8K0XRW4_9AGAR|nr:hypothetical protein BXZ70DRAFT_759575 [Cristinia sonorae]
MASDTEILGGYYIVLSISFALFGMAIAQAYIYSLNCEKDPQFLKFVVASVMLLESLHTVFIFHNLYLVLVQTTGYGPSFDRIVWSTGASVACETLLIIIVNGFYIRRIFILSGRNKILLGTLLVLLFVRTVFSIATITLMYRLGNWNTFRLDFGPRFTIGMSLGLLVGTDFFIASTLIFYLYQSRTGFTRTDHVLHTLIVYCVNTGLLTMICSILILIMFRILPKSLVFGGLAQMSSKLYANSFLGMMNMRLVLRPNSQNVVTSGMISRAFHARAASFDSPHIEVFRETSKTVYIGPQQPAGGLQHPSDVSQDSAPPVQSAVKFQL